MIGQAEDGHSPCVGGMSALPESHGMRSLGESWALFPEVRVKLDRQL